MLRIVFCVTLLMGSAGADHGSSFDGSFTGSTADYTDTYPYYWEEYWNNTDGYSYPYPTDGYSGSYSGSTYTGYSHPSYSYPSDYTGWHPSDSSGYSSDYSDWYQSDSHPPPIIYPSDYTGWHQSDWSMSHPSSDRDFSEWYPSDSHSPPSNYPSDYTGWHQSDWSMSHPSSDRDFSDWYPSDSHSSPSIYPSDYTGWHQSDWSMSHPSSDRDFSDWYPSDSHPSPSIYPSDYTGWHQSDWSMSHPSSDRDFSDWYPSDSHPSPSIYPSDYTGWHQSDWSMSHPSSDRDFSDWYPSDSHPSPSIYPSDYTGWHQSDWSMSHPSSDRDFSDWYPSDSHPSPSIYPSDYTGWHQSDWSMSHPSSDRDFSDWYPSDSHPSPSIYPSDYTGWHQSDWSMSHPSSDRDFSDWYPSDSHSSPSIYPSDYTGWHQSDWSMSHPSSDRDFSDWYPSDSHPSPSIYPSDYTGWHQSDWSMSHPSSDRDFSGWHPSDSSGYPSDYSDSFQSGWSSSDIMPTSSDYYWNSQESSNDHSFSYGYSSSTGYMSFQSTPSYSNTGSSYDSSSYGYSSSTGYMSLQSTPSYSNTGSSYDSSSYGYSSSTGYMSLQSTPSYSNTGSSYDSSSYGYSSSTGYMSLQSTPSYSNTGSSYDSSSYGYSSSTGYMSLQSTPSYSNTGSSNDSSSYGYSSSTGYMSLQSTPSYSNTGSSYDSSSYGYSSSTGYMSLQSTPSYSNTGSSYDSSSYGYSSSTGYMSLQSTPSYSNTGSSFDDSSETGVTSFQSTPSSSSTDAFLTGTSTFTDSYSTSDMSFQTTPTMSSNSGSSSDESSSYSYSYSSSSVTMYTTQPYTSSTDGLTPSSSSSYVTDSSSSSVYNSNLTPFTASIHTYVVTEGTVPKLALSCDFVPQADFDYKVEWRADNANVYNSDRLSWDQVTTHYITEESMTIDGFALEKTYTCAVHVYYVGGSSLVSTVLSEESRPVQFSTTALTVVRGQDTSFTISVNIPLPRPADDEAVVEIKLYDPDENYDCSDSALGFIDTDTCGKRIVGSTNHSQDVGDIEITVTTTNNQWYWPKNNFRFRIRFEITGQVEQFWAGTFSQEFTVSVSEDNYYWMGAYCFAANDPRMSTFDNVWYDFITAGSGIHTLYQHTGFPAEVQMKTEPCGGFGLCACGVAIRYGKDVYVIDVCDDIASTGYYHTSGNGHLYVRRFYDNYYRIYLPYGTVVDVGISPRSWFGFFMLNIYIWPSPNDVSMVGGLCGTLNNNRYDDLTHRGGSTETNVVPGWGWWWWWTWWQPEEPVDFISSWETPAAESLWTVSVDDLVDGNELKKCVCTGSDGTGEMLCSTQDERLCLSQNYNGVEITRRSAENRIHRIRKSPELKWQATDKRLMEKIMKIKEERRAASFVTRTKRQADSSDSCSLDQAYNICSNAVSSTCGEVIGENGTESNEEYRHVIVACALDKNQTNNCTQSYERSSCAVVVTSIQNEVQKNTTINEADAPPLCPNLCNGNGDCNSDNDVCSCYNNYISDDCGIDERHAVQISLLNGGEEMCAKPCPSIPLSVSGVTASAVCRIWHMEVNLPNNTVTDYGYSVVIVTFSNLYEVHCPLPSSRRRRSVSSGTSIAASVYEISVSNDGSTYGSSSPAVVLDSTCLTYTGSGENVTVTLNANYCLIDGTCYQDGDPNPSQTCVYCSVASDTFGWTLTSGNCYIDEVCYSNETKNPGDSCQYCHETLSTSEWTQDNETVNCMESDSSSGGMEAYLIAIIVIVVLLVLAGVAGAVYFLYKKPSKTNFRQHERGYDNIRNSRFMLHVEPTNLSISKDPEGKPQTTLSNAKWKLSSGLHDNITKPRFLLENEPTSLDILNGPGDPSLLSMNRQPVQSHPGASIWGNIGGLNGNGGPPRIVLPPRLTEGVTPDHPPPALYEIYNEPEPGTEDSPTNLYTERGSDGNTGAPLPVQPERNLSPDMPERSGSDLSQSSRRLSTGHNTPQGDGDRVHTPTMPNIEH